MKTVFQLSIETSDQYGRTEVVGIYSTPDFAEQASHHFNARYFISEIEIDPPIATALSRVPAHLGRRRWLSGGAA